MKTSMGSQPLELPQLVISVRDLGEAFMAQRAGADVIDVKEPTRGSLGAADRQVVNSILEEIADVTAVSVACGELMQWVPADSLADRGPVRFAKVGLAGCRSPSEWEPLWNHWRRFLPGGTSAVMASYVDWQSASAPPPAQVIAVASGLGADGVLFDTWDKSQGNLFDFLADHELIRLVKDAAAKGLWIALAGKLEVNLVGRCLALGSRYLAFRGAVCHHDRTKKIDESRLQFLVEQVRSISQNFQWTTSCSGDNGKK